MNKRRSKTRQRLLTKRPHYYSGGGAMAGMIGQIAQDAAGSTATLMNAFSNGLNSIAAMNHQKFMKEQMDLQNDYARTVEGRAQTNENNLAIQGAKNTLLQQSQQMAANTQAKQQAMYQNPPAPMFANGGNLFFNGGFGTTGGFGMDDFGMNNFGTGIQSRVIQPFFSNNPAPTFNSSTVSAPPAAVTGGTTTGSSVVDTSGGGGQGAAPTGMGGAGSMVLGAALTMDSALGNIVGGDYHTGAGDVISKIPGLGLVGGLTNRILGMKANQAELNRVKGDQSYLSNAAAAASAATSFDDQALNGPMAVNLNVNAYKGGLFSKGKARRKNRALREELRAANNFANRSSQSAIENLQDTQMDNLMANFAAFGGPLFANGGRIQNANKQHHAFGGDLMTHGANFDTGVTLVNTGGRHEQNPYEGVPMGVDQEGTPNLVEEGEVIFNDYVFSNRLKVPKSVRNKYKLRGKKDLTFADAALQMSKESEERPNDPISQNGLEALLGELAYTQEGIRERKQAKKTYAYGGEMGNIFSGEGDNPNILAYPGGSAAIANANTYGDWANFRFGDTLLYDPNTRRYNNMYVSDDFMNWAKTDPAALEFAKTWWGNKDNAQNYYSKNKTAPTYDDLFVGTKGRKALMYDAPFGNAQAYSDAHRYGRALFEQYMNRKQRGKGERRYLTGQKDAAGTPLPDTLITDWNPELYEYVRTGSSFDADKDYTDYFYRKKSTPSNRKVRFRDSKDGEWTTYDSLDAAMDAGIDLAEFGTPAEGEEFNSYTKLAPGKKMPEFDNWMRYAPIAGSLTGLGTSLFSKPDESGANAILEAARGASTVQPVSFKPVDNYLIYTPFDTEFAASQANAESNAARRALVNTSGGNRAQAIAGILAANNNALNQLGVLRRGAAEDNFKQRQMVEDFNRATKMFNSEGDFKAQSANQAARLQAGEMFLRGISQAEDLRQRAKLSRENAIQANLSSLFTSLGNIGQEQVSRKQMKWMIDNGFAPGYGTDNKAAKGGKIKRRKKGLTY